MSKEDWSRIIWSDEAYILLDEKKGTTYITRRPDEVFNQDCVVPTFKQSGVRIMVWGCIMHNEKGPLVILEYPGGRGGGMNSKRYRKQVLKDHLYNFYTDMLFIKKK